MAISVKNGQALNDLLIHLEEQNNEVNLADNIGEIEPLLDQVLLDYLENTNHDKDKKQLVRKLIEGYQWILIHSNNLELS